MSIGAMSNLCGIRVTVEGRRRIDPVPFADPAWSFLQAAWRILEDERVLPVSRWHVHLRVGHDYYGPTLHHAAGELELYITSTYPRFSEDIPLGERAFASTYIYPFLETCIALIAKHNNGTLTRGDVIDECMDGLHRALIDDVVEVACIRVLSHVDTITGGAITVAGLHVQPLRTDHGTSRLAQFCSETIFGSAPLISDAGHFFAPPDHCYGQGARRQCLA